MSSSKCPQGQNIGPESLKCPQCQQIGFGLESYNWVLSQIPHHDHSSYQTTRVVGPRGVSMEASAITVRFNNLHKCATLSTPLCITAGFAVCSSPFPLNRCVFSNLHTCGTTTPCPLAFPCVSLQDLPCVSSSPVTVSLFP